MQAPKTIEVFCSYVHNDEVWLRKLETHLSLLKRQGLISLWHDRRIAPGADWATAIDTHLETASIILLLVSADFLASDYCYGTEMKRALERHRKGETQVIPILIRPVDWNQAPFAHLRVLPTNAKPLALWTDKDAALTNISENLRRLLEGEPLTDASAPHPVPLPIWNVPYRRNPHFTGRDEQLDRLAQQFSSETQDHPTTIRRAALTQPQAIKGLGGIGKTQIAVEYAYRSREIACYMHTLWVNAVTEETMSASFKEIAELLPSFSARDEIDQQKLVEAVKRWLEQCEQRWLLIFDNADDLLIIQGYLPQRGNGSILLTTRANAVGSLATSIEVEKMGMMEGVQLLLHRVQREDHTSDEEINEAINLVVALDHFPLALDQAGAYIEETGCSFIDYLQVYQGHRQALLARRGLQTTKYPNAVATTWSLSFQKVEQANPAAAELLRLSAFLAPDKIPEELIKEGAACWSPLLQRAAVDLLAFNQVMTELLKFSLVKRLNEAQTFSIHRLVQVVQIDMMEPEVQREWAERVVQAVNGVFPGEPEDPATWAQCLRYLDQAQVCRTLIRQYTLPLIAAANLMDRTGLYLKAHGLYAIAEPLLQHAVEIKEQQLGPEHPHTAITLHNLAGLYRTQGKYAEAEPLYQRALAILEQQSGPEHPLTATALNSLATYYREQRKYAEAEPLYQRALAILEQQSGPEHPLTATCLNNLAGLYTSLEKFAEAEPLYLRALNIRERVLGPEHPSTALSLNGLATHYHEQGKYIEAEPLYQRTLAICEKMLGSEHPNTATALNNLARVYVDQGKYAEAESLYLRALNIFERVLGPKHLDTATILGSLGYVYKAQGKYAETELLYQRTLNIFERVLGPEHLDTAAKLRDLALLYDQQEKYTEAEPLFLRALAIREKRLGPEHPDTAVSFNDLAWLYSSQGKHAEAESLFQRVLNIRERVLGSEHLDTATSLRNLARSYQNQGKYTQAEPLLARTLAIYKQKLGVKHPNTASSLNDLVSLYERAEKYTEAVYVRALSIYEQQLGPEHPNTVFVRRNYLALVGSTKRESLFVSSSDQSDEDGASTPFFSNPWAEIKHNNGETQSHSSEQIPQEKGSVATNQALPLDLSSLIYLVRGKDSGRNAWHYVLIDQAKLPLFSQMIETGSLDISEYGKILYSGWGEDPPPEIVKAIKSLQPQSSYK